MSLILGSRPTWLRVLLVPSQPFRDTIGVADGQQITDPVALRFDAGQVDTASAGSSVSISSAVERVIEGQLLPDGTVVLAASAEQVNQIIHDCAALSRRVRVTIGSRTWGAGYFEIDGEW